MELDNSMERKTYSVLNAASSLFTSTEISTDENTMIALLSSIITISGSSLASHGCRAIIILVENHRSFSDNDHWAGDRKIRYACSSIRSTGFIGDAACVTRVKHKRNRLRMNYERIDIGTSNLVRLIMG